MVSQSEHIPVSTPPPGMTDDRGIREPNTAMADYPGVMHTRTYAEEIAPRYHSFWGATITGTLLSIAVFVLSFALMFGCRVGVDAAGTMALGWGAAIWICVTSAIALFVGGYTASCMTRPVGMGWSYGLSVWGLGVPLSFVLTAFVAGSIGMAHGLDNTTAAAQPFSLVTISGGAAWTFFLAMIIGLIFSLIGGMSGATAMIARARKD